MNREHCALVVDDEKAVRALAVRALCDEGFRCDEAADGIEAGELLKTQRYNAIVTDLRMPRENGHALAAKILARRPRPVIVVLTGVVEPSLAEDLIARGADDVVFKPVDYKPFAAKVKQLVEGRRGDHGSDGDSRGRRGWLGWFNTRFGGITPDQCLPALELLDAQGPLSLQQLRDRAVISLALQGVSPVGIAGLRVDDLQLSRQADCISVLRDGERFVTRLSYQTSQCLRDYLQSCGHHNDADAFLLQPLVHETSLHELGHVPPSVIEELLTDYVVSVR